MTYATRRIRHAGNAGSVPRLVRRPETRPSLPFYDRDDLDIDVVLIVDRRSLIVGAREIEEAVRLLSARSLTVRVDPVRVADARIAPLWDRRVRALVERIGRSGAIPVCLDPELAMLHRSAGRGAPRHPGATVRHLADVLVDLDRWYRADRSGRSLPACRPGADDLPALLADGA